MATLLRNRWQVYSGITGRFEPVYAAEISEGEGSRIRIKLNNVRAVFHRPHPKKETDKGAVASMKRFLENAGVKP